MKLKKLKINSTIKEIGWTDFTLSNSSMSYFISEKDSYIAKTYGVYMIATNVTKFGCKNLQLDNFQRLLRNAQ